MSIVGARILQSIHIAAPPETVFKFFTDPVMHTRWLGREVVLDLRPGGIYRCVVNDSSTVAGAYVEVDRPHRVVFTWGFEGNVVVPPGSSVVTVTLERATGGTEVQLVHTGLPHPMLNPHDTGLARVPRLPTAGCGQDRLISVSFGACQGRPVERYVIGATDGSPGQAYGCR